MQTINLSGITFCDLSDFMQVAMPKTAENMNVKFKGSFLRCKLEENQDAESGFAYAVYAGETRIGYLPELSTIAKAVQKAQANRDTDKHNRESERYAAAEAIRNQLQIDKDNNGTTEWPCYLYKILLKKNGVLLDWPVKDFHGVEVASISVLFEEVE